MKISKLDDKMELVVAKHIKNINFLLCKTICAAHCIADTVARELHVKKLV